MNAREANVLLTRAALLDPYWRRAEPAEQAERASVWAEVLEDVALVDALKAVDGHYRAKTSTIMPADVLEFVGIVDELESSIPDVTAEVVAESKRRALAAAGVTEAELQAHAGDVAWLRAHFPADVDRPVLAGDAEDFPE